MLLCYEKKNQLLDPLTCIKFFTNKSNFLLMFQFQLKASFFSSGEVGVFPIPPPKKALPKKTSMHAFMYYVHDFLENRSFLWINIYKRTMSILSKTTTLEFKIKQTLGPSLLTYIYITLLMWNKDNLSYQTPSQSKHASRSSCGIYIYIYI